MARRPSTLVVSAMRPVVAAVRRSGAPTCVAARVWDEPDRRVSARTSDALWVAAQRELGEDLPLRLAAAVEPATYGHLTYLLAAAPTVGVLLRALVRRYALLGDATAHHLEVARERARLVVELRGGPRPPCVETFAVAVVLAFLRRQTAGRFTARRVGFARARPADRDRHGASLRAPIEYGATWCGIEMDRSALEIPIVSAAPELLRLLEAHADHVMAHDDEADVVHRVAERIAIRGARAGLGAAEIAADLGWSERTLRRRLAGAATSFQALLDEALHAAAIELSTHGSPSDVAFALGYADADSLRRALRRWRGASSRALGVRQVEHERRVDDVGVVDLE